MLTGCQSQNTYNRLEPHQTKTTSAYALQAQTLNPEQDRHIEKIKKAITDNDQKSIIEQVALLAQIKTNRTQAFKIIYEMLKSKDMADIASEALKNINNPTSSELNLLAEICSLEDDHKCVVESVFGLSSYLGSDKNRDPFQLNNLLWHHLTALLNKEQYEASSTMESDWIELANNFRNAESISQKTNLWESWKRMNPNHPISTNPPDIFIYLEKFQPPKIAVIIPLSGNLKSVGKAVRDGIVANHLTEEAPFRGELHFHDSESANMPSIIDTIKKNHASLIIGPLLKHHSKNFVELTQEEKIPTLLLNYLEEPTEKSDDQYSIGLSIEDEIDELITHLRNEANNRLLIVANNSSWATRSNSLFIEKWPVPSAIARFEKTSDMTTVIGSAAGSEASFTRKANLSKLLKPEIEFLPRSRKDIDAVIVFVSPLESSALEPILKFHYLDSVPVYATSQSELSDIKFDSLSVTSIEFPFINKTKERTRSLKNELGLTSRLSQELFALGLDSYNLAQILPIVSSTPTLTLAGQTGTLNLAEHNTFKRTFHLTKN